MEVLVVKVCIVVWGSNWCDILTVNKENYLDALLPFLVKGLFKKDEYGLG